jgi:spermidine/putrescine transport system permease protein
MTIGRRLIPYWLLAPGALWLLLFFVVPMGFMAQQALESGSLLTGGFTFTWEWSNFPDSLSGNSEQIVRSFYYAGAATILAQLISYPLAYAISQQSGRWRLLLLFAVIAPLFTTYLIRTLA